MPVLPAVASRTSPPGLISPRVSASRMIWRAARSLTDSPGFMNSALPRIVQPVISDARRSLIRGVCPIASRTSERIIVVTPLVGCLSRTALRQACRARSLLPPRCGESVERYLEVAPAVVLRRGQPAPGDVHLQGRQDQLRQMECGVPSLTEGYELWLTLSLLEVNVVGSLLRYRARPSGCASTGHVVVPRKQTCVVGQRENALEGSPQLTGVAAREVAACRAVVGHQKRVMNKGRVADDVGHGGERVAG